MFLNEEFITEESFVHESSYIVKGQNYCYYYNFFQPGLFGESFQVSKCDLFSPQHNSDMCLSKYIYFASQSILI